MLGVPGFGVPIGGPRAEDSQRVPITKRSRAARAIRGFPCEAERGVRIASRRREVVIDPPPARSTRRAGISEVLDRAPKVLKRWGEPGVYDPTRRRTGFGTSLRDRAKYLQHTK